MTLLWLFWLLPRVNLDLVHFLWWSMKHFTCNPMLHLLWCTFDDSVDILFVSPAAPRDGLIDHIWSRHVQSAPFDELALVSSRAVTTRRRNWRWSSDPLRALWSYQAFCSAKSIQWHIRGKYHFLPLTEIRYRLWVTIMPKTSASKKVRKRSTGDSLSSMTSLGFQVLDVIGESAKSPFLHV